MLIRSRSARLSGVTNSAFHSRAHRRGTTRRLVYLAVAGALLAAACSDSDNDPTLASTPDVETTVSSIAADATEPITEEGEPPTPATTETPADPTGALRISPNPNNTLSGIVDVRSSEDFTVKITATSGDHVVSVPETAVASNTHQIPLVGLRADRDYEVEAQLIASDGVIFDKVTESFSSGSIPDRFRSFEFSADPERSSPGFTIIEMQPWRDPASVTPQRPFDDPQYLIALDNEGEVVWYYENGPVIGGVEQTGDGTFTSTYFPNGIREFDMLGNDVATFQLPIRNLELTPEPDVVFVAPDGIDISLTHHEGYRLPNGNYLGLSTASHALTPEQREAICPGDELPFGAISDVALEFEPNGKVLRTWDLWDVIDIDETPGGEMCNAFFAVDGDRDWTHANAVVYDEARDAVIFSSRHTNQVVAMKHLEAEGPQTELLWILGENGTLALEGDGPRYQHAVEVQSDGSLLMYDNGNGRLGTDPTDPQNLPYSRAVLYEIDDSSDDPSEWTATQLWEHRMNDADGEALFAPFIGDADSVANGNVLITHGGIDFMHPNSFLHATIVEVVPDGSSGGDIVWQFDAGTADDIVTIYRSERIESFYVGPNWVSAD